MFTGITEPHPLSTGEADEGAGRGCQQTRPVGSETSALSEAWAPPLNMATKPTLSNLTTKLGAANGLDPALPTRPLKQKYVLENKRLYFLNHYYIEIEL